MPNEPIKRRWTVIGIAMLTALLVAPTAVWATHSFTDVPDTNTFHEDIEAISDARVTLGCNPPDNTEYCPDDFVTREQMAAFMNRLGALDTDKTPVVNARAVQGNGIWADTISVEVTNTEDNAWECEATTSLRGSEFEFGSFLATYEVVGTPAGVFPGLVHVAASDDSSEDDPGFLLCFATVDGTTDLPDGTYTVYALEAHAIGGVSD